MIPPFVPFEKLLQNDVRFGFSPALPDNCQHSYLRLLKLNAVQPFFLDLHQHKPIAQSAAARSQRFQVQPGSFLLNRAGRRENVGRAVLVRDECLDYCYPDLMISFTVREDLILADFLELYLQSKRVRNYFANHAVGSNTSMVKINRRILFKLPVFLPPLQYQKQLLPLFNNLRRLYSGYYALNRKKHFFFSDLTNLFFSQTLALKSTTPKKWETKKMSQIFKPRNDLRKESCAVPLIVSKQGIYPAEQRQKNKSSRKFVKPGDFVLSLRASENGIQLSLHLGLVSPAYTVLSPTLPIVPAFYAYLFKSQNFIMRVLNTAISGTRGDGRIDWKILSEQRVCYPSIAEQTEIAGLFALLEKKLLLERQLEKNVLEILFSLSNSMQNNNLLNQYAAQTAYSFS